MVEEKRFPSHSFDDTFYFLYQAFQITVSYVFSWIIEWDLIYLWVAWSDYSAQLYIIIYIYTLTQSSDRFIRQIHLFDDYTGVRVTKVMSYWLVQPLYIYIYIYIYYVHTYIVGGKRQINYKFILTSLFCGCPLIRGSPCRDESIVSLFFSPITTHTHTHAHTHIYICIHICLFIYINTKHGPDSNLMDKASSFCNVNWALSPEACFWHSATLQPWSVSQVAEMWQSSGLITNPAMQALNLIE